MVRYHCLSRDVSNLKLYTDVLNSRNSYLPFRCEIGLFFQFQCGLFFFKKMIRVRTRSREREKHQPSIGRGRRSNGWRSRREEKEEQAEKGAAKWKRKPDGRFLLIDKTDFFSINTSILKWYTALLFTKNNVLYTFASMTYSFV